MEIIIYDYKRKKKVSYRRYIVDNRITGRKEKIVDVGNYLEKNEEKPP